MSKSPRSRRTWSAKDKMRVVLAGMEPGVEVSAVCRKEGVSPTVTVHGIRIDLGEIGADGLR